jgi:uncharacterized protein YdaU (DUF1376 family)
MKIRYVQLESDAFLTDLDFMQFSPAERGVYCSLILLLNTSGGKCEHEPASLAKMCNCTKKEFEKIWNKIEKKFQTRKGVIKHKRVTKELRKSKKQWQAKRRAGLKGAQVTWQSHGNANGSDNGSAMAKRREEKLSKENVTESKEKEINITNSNSYDQSCSSSISVRASRPDDRGQRAEDGSRRTEDRGQKSERGRDARDTVECDDSHHYQDSERGQDARDTGLPVANAQETYQRQAFVIGRIGDLIPSPGQLEQRRQSQLRALAFGRGPAVTRDIAQDEPSIRSQACDIHVQGLNFHESLASIIRPRSQSDRTCFRNVTRWLVEGCARGRFTQDVFGRVLDFAKEACNGDRPAAVLMALLKKELGYGREN